MQKCDLCNKTAVVHEVTVRNGVKKEIHLCESHAREAGIVMPGSQPINQLLTQFVISQTSKAAPKTTAKNCPGCGLTFTQFRQAGRLGCTQCYTAFETELSPIIERAQNGGTHHAGKSPRRGGVSVDREILLQRLARELDQAVAAEQYERAAQLRDRLTNLDSHQVATPRSMKSDRGAEPATG